MLHCTIQTAVRLVARTRGGLSYTPTASGTYYVEVYDFYLNNTGSYTLETWALPTVSIADTAIAEGNSGVQNATFTLSLSSASPVPVSVVVTTSGTSTATVGADFNAATSTVTFAAGQTTATFTTQVKGDTTFEPTEAFYVNLSTPQGAVLGDSSAVGLILDNDSPYANLPTDPFLKLQWYLYDRTGINVFPVWRDYTGNGVKVAVFDQGIDPNHADINNNLLVGLGVNSVSLSAGGAPVLATDNHGTAVAGTIAAERDGNGTVGVAYGANLVSIYSPLSISQIGEQIANAYTYAKNFDVLNDSWGLANGFSSGTTWAFYDSFQSPEFAAAGAALSSLAATGRNGLGTVVVQSAGNSYNVGDDTNLHNFQNSQYIITVAATDYFGDITSYSSPGASILVAAPGGGGTDTLSDIITTDRVGLAGNNLADYTSITGTSFSAPIVSGIVALMLDANPNLGYRDVQEILAYSARVTSTTSNVWDYNGASNWNGGGLHFDSLNHDLGFGLVDATAAVRLAETWSTSAHTAANRQQVSVTHSPTLLIPDNSIAGAFDSISITQAIDVERVEVTLNVTHPFVGDLSVLLTSPSGTTSFVLWRPQQNPLNAYGTSQSNINFTFDTVLDWGESSVGTWGISILDSAGGYVGTFDSWTLNLIGKPTSVNDTYIYTNEFAEACVDQNSRATLSDSSGVDTLNAAACSSNSLINLASGSGCTVDGQILTIASGTIIENAYCGDGNDTIIGNSSINNLRGGRGNDILNGGVGVDTLIGGAGNDTYVVDNVLDVITESTLTATEVDTVQAAVNWTLGSNLENLALTGIAVQAIGNTLNNLLTGNAAANTLNGGVGADTMIGGLGNDTYVVDNAADVTTEASTLATEIDTVQSGVTRILGANLENLTLTGTAAINGTGNTLANALIGNAAVNTLTGDAGNDTLNGGAGIDTMIGGLGNDTYVVDNAADVTTETSTLTTEIDTVQSSVTRTLGVNLENLTLTGTAAINGTGNTLNNTLTGNSAANTLTGDAGNDTLNGGAGIDTMIGGAGNDTYVVDNAGDITTDISTLTTEIDTVQSSVTRILGGNLENLTLTGTAAINGTGNTLANTLIGNAAANILDGGAGNDILRGDAGNDTLNGNAGIDWAYYNTATAAVTVNLNLATAQATGGAGSDTLSGIENLLGSNYNDVLTGNALDNTLNGGSGNDRMAGGTGNDTYVVNVLADVVTELAGAGTDTIQSSITYSLVDTDGAGVNGGNVENLTLIGTAAINGTGNALTNTLIGNAAANALDGGAGNDVLRGDAGNDTLNGNAGIDWAYYNTATAGVTVNLNLTAAQVTGGAGSDTLIGIENLLGGNFNDILTGNTAANTLSGGVGNDILNGGAGNDILIGGAGKDTLTGGTGADTFKFIAASESLGTTTADRDVVADFVRAQGDKIDLSGIDANTTATVAATGNQAFNGTLISSTATFSVAGQLQLKAGVLYGNTDTDAAAEFSIALTGVTSLLATDFVL